MSLYLFVDPGLTTGYAVFDDAGQVIMREQISGVVEFGLACEGWIQTGGWKAIVSESFKIFPHVKQGGSEVEAAQVIGILKHLCNKYEIPYSEVDPRHKYIGYKWSKKKRPTNHNKSHGPDAEAIGEYWLRLNKIKGMDDD